MVAKPTLMSSVALMNREDFQLPITVPLPIQYAAEQLAGDFYEHERSPTFRATWPNQDKFVQAKWIHHVDQAVKQLAGMLGHPAVPEQAKHEIAAALIEFNASATRPGARDVIQLTPNTEAYEGDKTIHRMDGLN